MNAPRFPIRRFIGQLNQTTLQVMQLVRDSQNPMLDRIGYTGRRVLGYKLPEWQRPEVWTDAQCVRFLESVWMGVSLGAFMVNLHHTEQGLDLILLDGQQRLRAIERYWAGELAVRGEDGIPYLWADLTPDEQNHFLSIPFPWSETAYKSEDELKEAYDRHNFGGTAHTEDQRAVRP